MVNHFSRCLAAMAVFAAVSSLMRWPVVSYSLFATGVAAVVLTDVLRLNRLRRRRRRFEAGATIALPGFGVLGGPSPALLLIVPVAWLTSLALGHVGGSRAASEPKRSAKDDPLTNLCVSVPSAVALLAFLALA